MEEEIVFTDAIGKLQTEMAKKQITSSFDQVKNVKVGSNKIDPITGELTQIRAKKVHEILPCI